MRSPDLIYRLLHKDYPESFTTYNLSKNDFFDLVHSLMPEGWEIQRRDMWFYCSPFLYSVPAQGWKIHVSATPGNCREVLGRIASVLFKYNDVSFKFSLDCALLLLVNSKNWPRSASGKFITIYPSDSRRFLELIEEIAEATSGMKGPYILSDHRYRGSQVVFYRYGGMRMEAILNVEGEKTPVLTGPSSKRVPDQRLAYPVTPAWEKPIFPVGEEGTAEADTVGLQNGRYTVETAVSFSSAGGVYIGRDHQTGKKVIIKEARPCINSTHDGYDAVELLKKEHRLLSVLAHTGIAPQPIELFQEWEHWFLVEEFIDGTAMSHHSAANGILLRTRASAQESDEWRAMFLRLCAELIRILKTLHSHKVIFGDLSTNNLIVTAGQQLKIIDFEGAYQPGVDRATNVYTPGYLSQHRVAGGEARQEDDYFSAGAVLLAYLLPVHGLLHLNPEARREFLASIGEDAGLSEDVADWINHLMEQAGPAAALADGRVAVLEPCREKSERSSDATCSDGNGYDYQATLDDIVRHLNGVADHSRMDRLYPSDPKVFSTNPLSLAYGATGVAYALHKVTGAVPEAAVDWILQHRLSCTEYAPGLYVGLAGIGWALLEMGRPEAAEEIFQSTFRHPLLCKSADLFYGMAGWGMTALRFFQCTGKEIYLEKAKGAGDWLLRCGEKSDRGYYWPKTCDEWPVGLAHGSSGIALFLLYLYLATADESYLAAGSKALDFDLAAGVGTKDGGLSWGKSVQSSSPLYPYWRYGSAGMGIVTVRFQRLIASPRYQAILEQIYIDTDRKYSVFPGVFMGLAGLSGFLLDMHELTKEQRFVQSAHKVAEGIMHFRVERNGIAFPGELTSRLCCDYGTGSAGIALFLNRLLGKQQSDFMLDGLLPSVHREEAAQRFDVTNRR